MNHRAKYNAASFILGGEIRNRTNTQTKINRLSTFAYRLMVWIITQVTIHAVFELLYTQYIGNIFNHNVETQYKSKQTNAY